MKKFLLNISFILFLSSCAPDQKNIIGMDNSWIKPLAIIFSICAAIVLVFVITTFSLGKKNYSFNFFEGTAFLAGPVLITLICYFLMAITGFLLVTFWSNILVGIIIFFIAMGLFLSSIQGKDK